MNRLWLKFALLSAGTATLGIVLAAVFVRQAMSTAFSHYLQDARGLGQMRGMMGQMMGPLETQYLSAVNNYLWIAGVLAVVAAALIAIVFSRQITAPVSRLSAAAERVKNGDLSQRVEAGSADEVGVLSRDFNAMVDALETNRDSRRKLMADLAHEMGTPLAVLQSNLEGIMDGLVEASPAQISSLHQETILLSRLVKDLRVLSEADSGRLALRSSTGDVAEVVEGVVDAMKNEAARRQIALALEAPGRGIKVNFDRDRISQVVANLLTNSLRYTPEGGQIKVSVRPYSEGRYILVSVSDTGQGISAEDLPRIFDRFYRGKVGTKRADGSGIGLAVVKELVEAHAGTVWVESREGEGSTFLFTLPVAN